MILPRRLFLKADGKFCEYEDVKQVKNFHPAGYPIPDAEAERIGLKAYLDETGWGPVAGVKDAPEEKAVAQAATEDKAVPGPAAKAPAGLSLTEPPAAVEEKRGEASEPEKTDEPGPGLHIDTETRRGRRG